MKKITDKDKKDWKNFTSGKDKVQDKDNLNIQFTFNPKTFFTSEEIDEVKFDDIEYTIQEKIENIANVITKPPIIVLAVGTSFIPKIGNQTQKMPPKTSVKDNKVRSAAGKFLDPIE